jgi:hypothetical protein
MYDGLTGLLSHNGIRVGCRRWAALGGVEVHSVARIHMSAYTRGVTRFIREHCRSKR